MIVYAVEYKNDEGLDWVCISYFKDLGKASDRLSELQSGEFEGEYYRIRVIWIEE